MRITSFYVKHYDPLFLNNVDSIQIDPRSKLILLLGRNGCGKTSLLKEFTFLPATPVNYSDGGIKIVKGYHDGNYYEAFSYVKKSSKNGKSAKHTFIKNGQIIHELATTQLHLQKVIEEFNYTHNTHRLLIGDILFTQMLPQARKEILTLINPLDLDYAIKFHNELKDKVRDTKAVLKHITIKNSELKTKLKSIVIPDDLNDARKEIEEKISVILPFSMLEVNENFNDLDSIKNNLHSIETKFKKHFNNRRVPLETITSLKDLELYINSLETKLKMTQTDIDQYNEELFSLSSISDQISISDMSKEELIERINYLEDSLNTEYKFDMTLDVNAQTIPELVFIEETIKKVYSVIPERYIDNDTRKSLKDEYPKLNKRKLSCLNYIDKLNSDINHISDPEYQLECPRCRHIFNKNNSNVELTLKELELNLGNSHKSLRLINGRLNYLEETLTEISAIEICEQELLNIKRLTKNSLSFWKSLKEMNLTDKDILFSESAFLGQLTLFRNDVIYFNTRNKLLSDLEQYKASLNRVEMFNNGSNLRIKILKENLNNKVEQIHFYRNEIAECGKLKKYIEYFENLTQQYDELRNLLDTKANEKIKSFIKKDAKERCNVLYSKMSEYNDILKRHENLVHSIKEMDDEQNKLNVELQSAILAEELISPKNGLIAKQMLGFISNYLDRINDIISEIWSYSMQIKPCLSEDGMLTYQFPCQVESKQIDDISDLSKSQREVVNLGFTIVLRHFLGLNQYPMYLDETGSEYDDAHRLSLIEFIKTILNNDKCSQLLYVNHYDIMFNAFSDADTVVIDPTNITISKPFNQIAIFNQPYQD